MKKTKYIFRVGTMKITVRAETYGEAIDRARCEADRRYEKANREPPTAWSIGLIEQEVTK